MNRNFLFVAVIALLMLSCASNKPKNKQSASEPERPMSSSEALPPMSSSSENKAAHVEPDTLVDSRDGKRYRVMAAGSQIWMAENLNYNAKGSKCYKNKSESCDTYGRLYDYATAVKVCPSGWHLPKKAEWSALADFAGGEEKGGKKLKAKVGWNGTDDFGFSALPGGHGDHANGFDFIGKFGIWWSDAMEINSEFSNNWYINERGNAKHNNYFEANESFFSSVRCIRNSD